MINYLEQVNTSFLRINEGYCFVSEKIHQTIQFDYVKESKLFYINNAEEIENLLKLIQSENKRFSFYNEIQLNINNEAYLSDLNFMLERQLGFLEKFTKAFNLYFADLTKFQSIVRNLQNRFDNIVCTANKERLSIRRPKEINEFLDEHELADEIPRHILIDQIADLDQFWLQQNLNPNFSKFDKSSSVEFIFSVQIYYIWIFIALENVINSYLPAYKKKVSPSIGSNLNDYIVLRPHFDNDDFKKDLYKKLLKNGCIECNLNEFNNIFFSGNNQICWLGTQVELTLIFKGISEFSMVDRHSDVLTILTKRFYGRKKISYKLSTLRSTHSKELNKISIDSENWICKYLKSLHS